MFSAKLTSKFARAALAGAMIIGVSATAQAGVVVKSSGPSAGEYPVGRQVADRATIRLRAGDRITVLTDSGTRVMQGPGTFRVGQGATRTRSRFSRLTQRGARVARTGASRSGEGAVRLSPNLWFINVAVGGNICAFDFSRVRLWRADTSGSQDFTITDNTNNTSLAIPFVGDEAVRGLDQSAMPLSFGNEYTITAQASEGREASSVTVTFVQMEGDFEGQDALAMALMEKGCTAQFEHLVNILERPAS